MPPRLTPPDWLVRTLRPQRAAVPWAAVVRASLAMAVPLAVGLATDRFAYGALASMGALSGVIGDTADAYRMRILNIAVPQLFVAVGVTVGSLVNGHGWFAVAAVTAVALVSGMVSTIGAVASVSGMLLLLNCVVGAGLPLPGHWWLAPLLMTGGGALVLVLALLAWPLRGGVPERAAVASTYRGVAHLLEAAGQDPLTYAETRIAVTQSLNQAYDLVLARRARAHGRNPELVRLVSQLNAVTPVVEAAPAAHQCGVPLPPQIPAAVRALADAIASGRPPGGVPLAPSTTRCGTPPRSRRGAGTASSPTSTTGSATRPRCGYGPAAAPATSSCPAPPGGTACALPCASASRRPSCRSCRCRAPTGWR
jgi:hypothetical protein